MQQEKIEQFLSSSNSGVRVIIGAGLNIVDVLMSDEYKTIFVTGTPEIIEAMTDRAPTSTFPFIIRTASSASSFFSKVIFPQLFLFLLFRIQFC
jgi:hypothetical protein